MQLFNERQSHFTLTSSATILNSGRSYAGTSLASFDHQKKPKRSFFARTFEVQKYSTKRGGLLRFSEIETIFEQHLLSHLPLTVVV